MKIQEVVIHLSKRLPTLTDAFTDTLAVSSLIHAGTTGTVITGSPHRLQVGDSVHIIGAIRPVVITTITHAYSGSPSVGTGIAIATTTTDHDLTLFSDDTALNVVNISGAAEAGFNGTGLTLLDVPNRRTFHYAVPISAPTSATGTIHLENGSNYFNTIRGQYAVATVTNSTTFTVEHTLATGLGTMTGTITARVKPRITGGIDDEGAIASYTRDAEDPATLDRPAKVWAYVILGPTTASRGPRHGTDGIDDQSRRNDWQQQILTPFQVLVVQSAANQTIGRNARDIAEDLLRPILRSILGKKFTSGLSQAIGTEVQFVGHGVARYDGATYWHEFNFEQRSTIGFADTIGADDDVAFRDWDLTGDPDIDALDGEGEIVQVTSLDDVPL